MEEYKITIWKAKDKFDNPSRSIYGERVRIGFSKPSGRKNFQLCMKREFKDYFEWHEAPNCCFKATMNKPALEYLICYLTLIYKEHYGQKQHA